MPLYNRLIEKVNEEEERPLGTADPLKIRPKVEAAGKWISDQYNRIPEESRTELERQLSIGLQPERWPDGTEKPNTFKILGEAYKPVQAVKDELSRATGLDPINFDAAEITADVLTPGIPLSKKALTGIVDIIDTSPFRFPNPKNLPQFVGGIGAGGWGPDYSSMHWATPSLRPEGPHKLPKNRKRPITSELTTGEKVTPQMEKAFELEGVRQADELSSQFGINIGKAPAHHKGILRQIFESMNGLDDEHIAKAVSYYERALGFKLGYSLENALAVPDAFHPRLHALINSRIASNPFSWDLKGIERKFNLTSDWKGYTEYGQRLKIFREVSNAIGDSVRQTNRLYKILSSRTNKLGKLSAKDYTNLGLDLIELDNKLRGLPSPHFMVKEAFAGIETGSDTINDILINAGKVDLTLPSFEKLNLDDLKVVAKAELIDKTILREALLSKQSANTVFNTWKELIGVSRKQFNDLLHFLDPDDLIKTGMSIEDVDTFLRTGTADPRKAKSSLIPIDTPPRTDYTIKQLKDMGRTPAEIQEYIDAGWVKLDYDDLFPER